MTAAPTRDAVAELIAKGASDEEVGRRFGLSRSAVRRLRRRWGIAARRTSRRPPAATPGEEALRWGRGDLSERAAARLYGGRRYDEAAGPPDRDRRE